MAKVLKIEAFSGASGDMFLGALAGLTNSYAELRDLPTLLNLEEEAEVKILDTKVNGIVCKKVKIVDLVNNHHNRYLKDILNIINTSSLSNNTKEIAKKIFNIIGKAEAEVHGITLEKIHFHEVGAVDSIIDICGTAYLLDKLDFDESYLATLVTGKGFVKTTHGLLPVPSPAAKLIIEGIPYILGDEEGEKLTPTGAAIIKYLNPKIEQDPLMDLITSYGAGDTEFNTPNLLRLSMCETIESSNDEMIVIETNIDDGNNEFLGVEFQNRLIEAGAVDFYYSQIIMKKGRPGLLLSIVCFSSKFEEVSNLVFNLTSTIGLRYYKVARQELERHIEEVETEIGKFRVKISTLPNGNVKVKPESEDVLKASQELNINPATVSKTVINAYEKNKS